MISTFKKPNKHNVFVCDVSGSMGGVIHTLSENLAKKIDLVPLGDAVTIGLFSSKGWFRWIVVREISEQQDYATIKDTINRELKIVGMTCFSEILQDTPKQINPLLEKFPIVSFTFMSDGCPTVANLSEEITKTLQACGLLSQYITAGSVIAYGDYANRSLLSQMASALGVELLTASNIIQVSDRIEYSFSQDFQPKKTADIYLDAGILVFASDDEKISVLEPKPKVSYAEGTELTVVYPKDLALIENFPTKVCYQIIKAYILGDRLPEAKEFCSKMGEVYLYEVLSNIYSNADYAYAENVLNDLITGQRVEFFKGKIVNCKPVDDAFDVLDLFALLSSSKNTKLLLRDKKYPFYYKRIGRKSETKAGYPKFQTEGESTLSFEDLVYSSDKLNLSIKGVIEGYIELPDTIEIEGVTEVREALKLPKRLETKLHRNYSLISNGCLNIEMLPISISIDVYEKLKEVIPVASGMLENKGDEYIGYLPLVGIPLVNNQKAKDSLDLVSLANSEEISFDISCGLKLLKHKLAELDPEKTTKQGLAYDDKQMAYLLASGVGYDGSFSPPVEVQEPVDELTVRTLEISLEGKTISSVKDFNAKVESKGKLNPSQQSMLEYKTKFLDLLPSTKAEAIVSLAAEVKKFTKAKKANELKINSARFALAVTGKWVENFKEDTQEVLTASQRKAKVVFGTETIKI